MALALNSNNTVAKFTLNTSKIQQGLSVNLSKAHSSLQRAAVKISWLNGDLDINAVRLGKDGKALLTPVSVKYKGREETVPKDLIFYQNLEQEGIKHGGDLVSSGDVEEEQILVATSDQPSDVSSIDFIVSSHEEKGAGLLFKDVGAMTAALIDLDTNEVLYSTDLDSSDIAYNTAAVFATFSKGDSGEWSYTTSAKGLGIENHGVQNILNAYYG